VIHRSSAEVGNGFWRKHWQYVIIIGILRQRVRRKNWNTYKQLPSAVQDALSVSNPLPR